MADHVVAFIRRHGNMMVLAVVPRLPTKLMRAADTIALDPRAWKGTVLRLNSPPQGLVDAFSGAAIDVPATGLPLAAVCSDVPVALLCTRNATS